jgi:hypothetical protein
MQFDPLVKYSTLIPGGLHYVPGGLNLPKGKWTRNEPSDPDHPPRADRAMRRLSILGRFTMSLRRTLTAFHNTTLGRSRGNSWLPAFRRPRSSRSGFL